MKRIASRLMSICLLMVGTWLAGTVEGQTQAYLRGTGRVIARPAVHPYQGGSYPVSLSRRYYGSPIGEPVPSVGENYGCARCCPAIIPTLLNGIGSVLDCLLPCRSCGLTRGCDGCGKGSRMPARSYRPGGCGCGRWGLPVLSHRFHPGAGSYCGCYGRSLDHGIPAGELVPQEAVPEEAIPKPIPDEEPAPRSARRFQTREEAQRYYQRGGSNLRLTPPRAQAPGSLQRYGRIAEDRSNREPYLVRTVYSREISRQEGLRMSSKPKNPLRR